MAEKEDKTQEMFVQYQMLEKKKEQISQHLQALMQQLEELEKVTSNLKELENVKPGTKIVVPLANGIFANATLEEGDLIVNIGSNVCVNKKSDKVREMLASQIEDTKVMHQTLDAQMKEAEIQTLALTKQLQSAK